MRLTAPPDAVDRSLARIRLVIGVVVIVVSAHQLQRGARPAVACVGIGAGLLIPMSTFAERAGRKLVGAPRSSALLVAVDTALVLATLTLADVGWGTTTSLVMVLPVLEAGVRHGVFGAAVAWGAVTAVVGTTTALEWDGTTSGLAQSAQYVALLLLVALPVAHLSEHLVDRVEHLARARSEADRRAEILSGVLSASGTLVSPDPEQVDEALVSAITELTGGRAEIIDMADDDRSADLDVEGPAVFLVGLGGKAGRVLRCATERALDQFTTDAVELLCAHADIARHGASLYASARLLPEIRDEPLVGS